MNDFNTILATAADPAAWRWLSGIFWGSYLSEAVRYLVVAPLLWLLIHRLLKRRLAHRLIDQWPDARGMRREFLYSLPSMLVFAAVGLFTVSMVVQGHWTVYRDPTAHGLWWGLLSLPALLVWQDIYFYWTHRLMHQPALFRQVHGLHHRSRQPSPFAAYAFHPLEALVHALMLPLALCVVPLPGIVLFIAGLHQIVRNAHGHLAIETMPRGFAQHALWGRFTTTTHHHMHHEFPQRGNFGLWFTWCDRLFGTEQREYLTRFAAATRPRSPEASTANTQIT